MPFTPFHFGPSACVALPAHRYIDLPVFLLANVAVDLEPLTVMVFRLDYPYHGYCHTFLIGAVVGLVCGVAAYRCRGLFRVLMGWAHLSYRTSLPKMLVSGVLGVWLHVLLDAPLYRDMRPFFPLQADPLYGLISRHTGYLFCTVCFLPAVALYVVGVVSYVRHRRASRSAPGPASGRR